MTEKTSKIIVHILSVIFCLIPLMMITGPFLPDLFLLIIILSVFYLMYLKKDFLLFNKKYFLYFILINLILILISLFSQNLTSIKSSTFYFRFGLFVMATFYLLYLNEKILKYLLFVLLAIYLGLFFDSIYQFYNSENIIGFKYLDENNFRITSFFGKDEILGSYTARLFPLMIFLILINYNSKNVKRLNLLITVFTLISFCLVMLSGERTSMALLLLTIIFLFLSSIKIRKILILPMIIIVLIFTVSVSISERLKNRLIDSTINQLGISAQSDRLHIFSKTYEGHYLISYKMFSEKPFFGHGPKMFRFYCSKKENYLAPNACTTHPHNFYAQMLAETGFFGFSILLGLFLFVIKMFFRNILQQIYHKNQLYTDEALCILSSIFMSLFPFLPSGNFFNNWLSLIIYYPLGFLIFIIYKKKLYE
tara:strand:+ start:1309 stop:2577 length:1269 start_codon:yes stop_codon:yes gene_type:complete